MIVGFGVDLVEVPRMERLYQRYPVALTRRLLAEPEYAALERAADAARFLAKRFAVKEAAAKALGTGIADGIRFTDLWVEHDARGAPGLVLGGIARQRADALGVIRTHLSLSDERGQVLACVILEAGSSAGLAD